MKAYPWLVLGALSALLLACGQAPDLDQPPAIRYGEDVCHSCNMIINEPRFAAAYYTVDGQARPFDDIGEMATFHAGQQEHVARFWVHDYDTEAWLVAGQATYVIGPGIHTPMGFGVVAFTERSRAEAFASELDAQVMSFEEVLAHYAAEGGVSVPAAGQHDSPSQGQDPG